MCIYIYTWIWYKLHPKVYSVQSWSHRSAPSAWTIQKKPEKRPLEKQVVWSLAFDA